MTPGGLEPHTSALKGLCPDLLDDGAKTRSLGLEPRPAVLETDMLPITPQPLNTFNILLNNNYHFDGEFFHILKALLKCH